MTPSAPPTKPSQTPRAPERPAFDRGLAALRSLKGGRTGRIILITAAIALTIAFAATLWANPEILAQASPLPFAVLVLVVTPVLVCLGTGELVVMGACLRAPLPWPRAFEVTVIGSAANLLPIPGTMATRIAALTMAGASAGAAALMTTYAGLLWLSLTMIAGGLALFVAGLALAGAATVGLGLVAALVCLILIARLGAPRPQLLRLLAVRSVFVLVDGIRTAVALAAIGVSLPLVEAQIFALSSALGSSLSLVPAGFGIREALSGAVAPLVGVTMAQGFAAAVLIRIADLIVLLGLFAGLRLRGRAAP